MMMTKTTRKGKRLAVLLTMALIVSTLAACTTQRAAVDYEPGVNFAQYRTYAWSLQDAAAPANPEDPRISPLTRERIRASVDQALLAKGFVKREPPDFMPDFMIGLRTSLSDRQIVHHWSPDPLLWRHGWRRWPYGPFGYDPFFARPMVSIVTEATLAIDMFDANTRQPIWHGHATRVVGRDDIHPTDIQRLVDAILANFPPSPPGLANVPPQRP